MTWARARRPKRCKLANNPRLRQAVASKLRLNWSPEQIGGWLKRCGVAMGVITCHTRRSIAAYLFRPAACLRKSCLVTFDRSGRSADLSGQTRMAIDGGKSRDIVSIRERPAAVEESLAVPGHWEGDLLSGSKNSYIATLVERHTRYVILMKIANKDTQTVISALIKQAKTLPNELYKSLTWDRGKELTDSSTFYLSDQHRRLLLRSAKSVAARFHENTNRLLRQYFPKGTDLSVHSQTYLNKVARQLNERPRKTLTFETPAGEI